MLGSRIRTTDNFQLVQGPHGCGKSALVARALDLLQADSDRSEIGAPSIMRMDLHYKTKSTFHRK